MESYASIIQKLRNEQKDPEQTEPEQSSFFDEEIRVFADPNFSSPTNSNAPVMSDEEFEAFASLSDEEKYAFAFLSEEDRSLWLDAHSEEDVSL